MPGVVYCLLAVLLGWKIAGSLITNKGGSQSGVNRLWLLLPGAFGIGMLVFGWMTYTVAWAASALGAEKPLFYGNLAVMLGAAVILGVIYGRQYKTTGSIFGNKYTLNLASKNRKRPVPEAPLPLITEPRRFLMECIFFTLLFAFSLLILFYVFFVSDGVLYSGFSVYGDYAPHTAMMRSFSLGNNYPTQYPHYGGEDIKYHFMFQFLVGNLEYLGIRIDIAYNVLSALALTGFLMMLYNIAIRVFKRFRIGVLTIVLFLFRSSLSFFRYVIEHVQAGDLLTELSENTAFIGYTPNETWGLWNFNVYLNQRHLAFGLLIVAFFLYMYLDWVEAGTSHEEPTLTYLKNRIFTKEAWKCRMPENALLAGMFLGLIAFWNGAALIGGLLILMGFAIFSDGKLDYLITAVTAVIFSVLQTKIFIWGNTVSTSFYWGFIAEDKTLKGVAWYILQMSGIYFFGVIILMIVLKNRSRRAILISTVFPFIFAFCVSLTPDVTVNQKYIMISYAFLAMFWAWAIVKSTSQSTGRNTGRIIPCIARRLLAVTLIICLTITGVYDFVIIIRNNGEGHRVGVRLESALTDWLAENLTHDDLILTPEYSISEVTMSGVMMYMGWPYYAWSAGYDTYGRAEVAKKIYSSYDPTEIQSLVEEAGITYILYEEGMTFEETVCHEETIAGIYTLVYTSEDGGIRIYETA